jgi:hypothetical protein
MSRIAEVIMHLLISMLIVIGFTIIVVFCVLKVLADLLAMSVDETPSLFDRDPQKRREAIRRGDIGDTRTATRNQTGGTMGARLSYDRD